MYKYAFGFVQVRVLFSESCDGQIHCGETHEKHENAHTPNTDYSATAHTSVRPIVYIIGTCMSVETRMHAHTHAHVVAHNVALENDATFPENQAVMICFSAVLTSATDLLVKRKKNSLLFPC